MKKRIYKLDDSIELARRLQVVKYRMCWPPWTPAQIARQLHVSVRIIHEDIKFMSEGFSTEYFAKTNEARVARATAEMEVIAFQLMADAQKLNLKAYAGERANLYGKALNALQERNRMLIESGSIPRAASKLEMTGKDGAPLQMDVARTTVTERIAALTAARQSLVSPDAVAPASTQNGSPAK